MNPHRFPSQSLFALPALQRSLLSIRVLTLMLGLLAWVPMRGADEQTALGRLESPHATVARPFALPQPGREFRFPADHGSHPEFKIEWWYLTGT